MQLSTRICQTCHTTVTSQWRYGLSGKVLLCNACGIRWKRKNKPVDKKRLKPGPKRAPHAHPPLRTLGHTSPSLIQPSLSATLHNPSNTSLIQKNFSTSSSVTDPRIEAYGLNSHQQTSTHSKMDLALLLSPQQNEPFPGRGKGKTRPVVRGHTARTSPISISSLLNFADDSFGNTACSPPAPRY